MMNIAIPMPKILMPILLRAFNTANTIMIKIAITIIQNIIFSHLKNILFFFIINTLKKVAHMRKVASVQLRKKLIKFDQILIYEIRL